MNQPSDCLSDTPGPGGSPTPQRLLIVTPTLGVSPYLDQTVRGITSLSIPFLHVISCPQPAIAQLAQRFPHARVVADAGREGAIYGAINAALAAAGDEWEWFTYINDDDELGPAFSETVRRHWASHDPEPVVYGEVRVIDESDRTISFLSMESRPEFIPAVLRSGLSPLNQQGMIFRRDLVRELVGFNTQYKICADLDFWARALAAGHGFRHYPVEMGRFRIRRGQISGDIHVTRGEQDEIARRLFPHAGSWLQRTAARLRFRFCNLPRYLARSRTVGWSSSEAILAGGKQAA
ncbi:MAG TPA: glycosyltransferase [Chthoniobacteraceae bacterium]